MRRKFLKTDLKTGKRFELLQMRNIDGQDAGGEVPTCVREPHIKASVRCTPMKAEIWTPIMTSTGDKVKKQEHSCPARGDYPMQPFLKYELTTLFPLDQATSLLGTFPTYLENYVHANGCHKYLWWLFNPHPAVEFCPWAWQGSCHLTL